MVKAHRARRQRPVGVLGTLLVLVLSTAGLAATAGSAGAADGATTAYLPIGPIRLADTRSDVGFTRLDARTVRVGIRGRSGVPAGTSAVALGVTATRTTGAGYVTAWPSGGAKPYVSQLTVTAAYQTRSASIVVPVGADGAVQLSASTDLDLVIDAYGVFLPATSARSGRLQVVTPSRLLDTRAGGGPPLGAGATRSIARPAVVPADATAVVVNLTLTASRAGGWLSVGPTGQAPAALSATSALSTDGAGQTRAALAVVPITAGGFQVFASSGGHVLVDLAGWFTGPSAVESGDGLFVPVDPRRLLDSRQGTTPLHPGGTVELGLAAGAALLQAITVTQAAGPGYLTTYAAGTARPNVSALNAERVDDTVTNLAVVQLSDRGAAYYSSGGAQLIVDQAGWFTGAPTAATLPVPPNVAPPPPPLWCPSATRAAVVDRAAQRGWLCTSGTAGAAFPITTARNQPAPGTYRVYAKDRLTTSTFGGHFSYLDNFVAFTRGIFTGARIGFHAVPRDAAGRPYQPYATVGTPAWYGQSSGCIRVLPDQSQRIWNHLAVGDTVVVVS